MSLVNQMLRDLEARQAGLPLASAALLDGIGSVEEPPGDPVPVSRWRLPLAGGFLFAALLAAVSSELPAALRDWLAPTGGDFAPAAPFAASSRTDAGPAAAPRPAQFALVAAEGAAVMDAGSAAVSTPEVASGIRSEPAPPGPWTDSAKDARPAGPHRPSAAVAPSTAVPPTTDEVAPSGEPRRRHGLRLALRLAAPPVATTVPAAPTAAAFPKGKASLPADLAAVAARFDREFEAGRVRRGRLPPGPPEVVAARAATAAPAPVSTTVSAPAPASRMVKTPVPASPGERSAALYADAQRALAEGLVGAADAALRELLSLAPGHVEGRRLLAGMLVAAGRREAADTLLAEGLAAAPGAAPLAQMRARLLVDLGRDAEALAVLEAAGPLDGELSWH